MTSIFVGEKGDGIKNVPGSRFELPRLLAPPPQDGASTNFATRV